MEGTIDPSLERTLAGPLLSGTDGLTATAKAYSSSLKDPRTTDERLLWDLIYRLQTRFTIAARFQTFRETDPDLLRPAAFLAWIEMVNKQQLPKPKPTATTEEIAFYHLICGEEMEFLETLKSYKENWTVATFAGAFSSKHFKLWRSSIHTLLDKTEFPEQQKRLYLALTGDLSSLKSFDSEDNFYTTAWIAIYAKLVDALCGSTVTVNEVIADLPEPKTILACGGVSALKGFSVFVNDKSLPPGLRTRVAVANKCLTPMILAPYLDQLVDGAQLSLAIFYSSKLEHEDAIDTVASIIAGLPMAENRPLELAKKFGLPTDEIVNQIISRMTDCSMGDFEGDNLTEDELTNRRVNSLSWTRFSKNIDQFANVRALLTNFIVEGNFQGAAKLFEREKGLFKDRTELDNWKTLIRAETDYDRFTKGAIPPQQALEGLNSVLNIQHGLNVGSSEICKACIPLISRQLVDVYSAMGDFKGAYNVPVLVLSLAKKNSKWFSKKDYIALLESVKKAKIAEERSKQQ